MKDRTQKICGRLVRDGNTAVGCSSMGGGAPWQGKLLR